MPRRCKHGGWQNLHALKIAWIEPALVELGNHTQIKPSLHRPGPTPRQKHREPISAKLALHLAGTVRSLQGSSRTVTQHLLPPLLHQIAFTFQPHQISRKCSCPQRFLTADTPKIKHCLTSLSYIPARYGCSTVYLAKQFEVKSRQDA